MKPEDIPQFYLDEAVKALDTMPEHGVQMRHHRIAALARAIMVAEKRGEQAAQSTLEEAGFVVLPKATLELLSESTSKAENYAGTMPARDAVKLRPTDWHAVCAAVRELAANQDKP